MERTYLTIGISIDLREHIHGFEAKSMLMFVIQILFIFEAYRIQQ